jgi:hypothetical protein
LRAALSDMSKMGHARSVPQPKMKTAAITHFFLTTATSNAMMHTCVWCGAPFPSRYLERLGDPYPREEVSSPEKKIVKRDACEVYSRSSFPFIEGHEIRETIAERSSE